MAETPRVLLVIGDAAGGIARHVEMLANGLPECGLRVTVCGPASSLAQIATVATRVPAPTGVTSPLGLLAARRELQHQIAAVDVVHAHGLRAGALAGWAAPAAPLVVTWHNSPLTTGAARLTHLALERYVGHAADLTLAASEDLAARARIAGAVAVRPIFVPAPLQASPSRTRSQVRAEIGAGERPLVLAVGRLQHQKRFDVLVEAAAGWAGQANSPLVVVAGDGPQAAVLQARIEAAGAPVRLLGARADIADLLLAADVVALPSEWEAGALVAQEALRAGVPLVATAVGGLPDLVGPAAVMVPVGDAPALRAALESVVTDRGLRARLAELGLARASTWPDAERVIGQLVRSYIDLMERLRPAH